MATQPTTPPSVTAWPDAPSRAEPATFSTKADAFLGHFPTGQADQNALVTWLNSTAGQSYQNALEAAASATASAASADLAQDALDNAISATNYKGPWSSLTGTLNIPASASHDNGVWLLTTNLANVAASEPAIGNPNWLLIYSRATDLQVETGVAYTNPDSKQLKDFVQRDWAELTTAKTYNDSCFYRGKEYDINIPVDDVTIAPPATAGRTFTNFNGTNQYITIPTINLVAGDIVKFTLLHGTAYPTGSKSVLDGVTSENRATLAINLTGSYSVAGFDTTAKIDGVSTYLAPAGTYKFDGLYHKYEMSVTSACELARLMARYNNINFLSGRIYDLDVIRGGERIHYYPLRKDAVDYIAGNLVPDEEFTNPDNWNLVGGVNVSNNALNFTANGQLTTSYIPELANLAIGTYRLMFEKSANGALGLKINNLADPVLSNLGAGSNDQIYINSRTTGESGFFSTSGTYLGSIKNFRVIKLNELSPSANFDSATGFILSGGVTVSGGLAVFDGSTNNSLSFVSSVNAGSKVRIFGSVSNVTNGNINVSFVGSYSEAIIISGGKFDQTVTIPTSASTVEINTIDGFDGDIDTASFTLVTDGTEVSSPLKTFERNWKLKSGEQLLPQSAGIVRFGIPVTIDASNTLEIEPLANASKGDYIKVTRANNAEPIIKLSAADISAGRLIRFGAQTDTELTVDSDKAVILEHNGIDLEVKL